MFKMINRDHATGAVIGVALLAVLSFMTGCSTDDEVVPVEEDTATTEETAETPPEDSGDTDPPEDTSGDTGTTGSDTGSTTSTEE